MSASAEDSPLYVAALARGISVLGAFTEGRPALTLPELAEATGLTKSAVQRFAHTLWVLGYLRKHPQTKKFSLAPLSLELGMRYAQTSALVLGGNPFLHSLNRSSQETCSLAEPDGLDMVYVARFATHKQMFVHMPVGKRLPIYCTAAGRAVLSRLDPARARELLAACRRRAFTNTTITDLDALMAESRSPATRAMRARTASSIPATSRSARRCSIRWARRSARSMSRCRPAAGLLKRPRRSLARKSSKPRTPSAPRAPLA